MQAKILYEQAHPIDGKELSVPQSELFIMHMARAFTGLPCELDKTHLERLTGMESTWTDVSENPYSHLIRAIKRLGSVRVWATYDDSKANRHDASVTADPESHA